MFLCLTKMPNFWMMLMQHCKLNINMFLSIKKNIYKIMAIYICFYNHKTSLHVYIYIYIYIYI